MPAGLFASQSFSLNEPSLPAAAPLAPAETPSLDNSALLAAFQAFLAQHVSQGTLTSVVPAVTTSDARALRAAASAPSYTMPPPVEHVMPAPAASLALTAAGVTPAVPFVHHGQLHHRASQVANRAWSGTSGALSQPSPASSGSSRLEEVASSGLRLHMPAKRSPRKRATSIGGPLDAESLGSSSLRNPVDALKLLVMAAEEPRSKKQRSSASPAAGPLDVGGRTPRSPSVASRRIGTPPQAGPSSHNTDARHAQAGRSHGAERPHHTADITNNEPPSIPVETSSSDPPSPVLDDYPLVKDGTLTFGDIARLLAIYFEKMHFALPLFSSTRKPDLTSKASLAHFLHEELPLATAILTMTSRHDREHGEDLHMHIWRFMQRLVADMMYGRLASVGGVEALLLLSDFLPRQEEHSSQDISIEENRMSWMLVGAAVRMGYLLGLDQATAKSPDSGEVDRDCDRERIAWTYCYFYDRQGAIRTGTAFWSRGPGLCFHLHLPPNEQFPSVEDDIASSLQALAEVTVCMTAAHDILYPSEDRTITLSKSGQYYKYLDDFTRSLAAFEMSWRDKQWQDPNLTDCVWLTYHYLRLYIYAFAFQALIQRASTDGVKEVFPRGLMGDPDVKFVLEAVSSAADMITIAVDRMQPRGTLQYLPWRYYMYFSYAAVFLIKACAVSAVVDHDRPRILLLLRRLITSLAMNSSDDQHPGPRYARFLTSLLKLIVRDNEGGTRPSSPHAPASNLPQVAATRQGSSAGGPSYDYPGAAFPDKPSHNFMAAMGLSGNEAHGRQHEAPPPPAMLSGEFSSHLGGSGVQQPQQANVPSLDFMDAFPSDWDNLDLGMDVNAASGASDALSYLLNKNALDSLWQCSSRR